MGIGNALTDLVRSLLELMGSALRFLLGHGHDLLFEGGVGAMLSLAAAALLLIVIVLPARR